MNQLSSAPSQTAVSGSTRSVFTSSGLMERLTPRIAWQKLLPRPSLPRCSVGVARTVTGVPPRSIWNSRVCPACALTIRCMSEKLSIFCPLIASTTSPGCRPAAAAGEFGWTASMRAEVTACRRDAKIAAKITMARMKLAIGPGRDNGCAAPHGLMKEAVPALLRAHGGNGGLVRHAGGVFIPKELHVSAQRDRRELPAGSIAIGKPEQFGAESDGKHQHPHPTPDARPGNAQARGRTPRSSAQTKTG